MWKASPPPGKAFCLAPLTLPTASLRELPLCDGSCPTLCSWVHQFASVAGASASEHGSVPFGAGQLGSQVAALAAQCVTSQEGCQVSCAGICDSEEQAEVDSRLQSWFKWQQGWLWGMGSHLQCPSFPLWLCFFTQGSPCVSTNRGKMFLAHKNGTENLGNVFIFFPGTEFCAPSHC